MKSLILYSTLGCHLCELAKQQIEPLLLEFSLTLVEVDIADKGKEDLLEKYGVHIPVIKIADKKDELGWPFTRQEVHAFLLGC